MMERIKKKTHTHTHQQNTQISSVRLSSLILSCIRDTKADLGFEIRASERHAFSALKFLELLREEIKVFLQGKE